MFYSVCRVKIKGGKVTNKNLYYDGSITISSEIAKSADILPGDMVDVLNLNNGARIATYVIIENNKQGEIILNGPAARFFEVGDQVVILSMCVATQQERKKIKMRVVSLSGKNQITKVEG